MVLLNLSGNLDEEVPLLEMQDGLSKQAVLMTLLLISILIGHALHRLNFRYATEGSVGLMIGIACGGIVQLIFIYYNEKHTLTQATSQTTFNDCTDTHTHAKHHNSVFSQYALYKQSLYMQSPWVNGSTSAYGNHQQSDAFLGETDSKMVSSTISRARGGLVENPPRFNVTVQHDGATEEDVLVVPHMNTTNTKELVAQEWVGQRGVGHSDSAGGDYGAMHGGEKTGAASNTSGTSTISGTIATTGASGVSGSLEQPAQVSIEGRAESQSTQPCAHVDDGGGVKQGVREGVNGNTNLGLDDSQSNTREESKEEQEESRKVSRSLQDLLKFDSSIFFEVLLPPIIFNAGYSIKKKHFFQNFFTLLIFGIMGTFLVSVMISGALYWNMDTILGLVPHMEPYLSQINYFKVCFVLGTIFSSTDSIAVLHILDQGRMPLLYSLVFGEGVVNDATAIVLLRAVLAMPTSGSVRVASELLDVAFNFSKLFVLSLLLGVAIGLVSALIIRHMFKHHATDREVFVVAALGFLAYLIADKLKLSGIFAVFFCGITMSHYTWHSLSPSAKVITIYMFRICSFAAEAFLFLYCGFDMWGYQVLSSDHRPVLLGLYLLCAVLLARALFVFPSTLIVNLWRSTPIHWRESIVIWWGGTFRGAITIALIYSHFNPETKSGLSIIAASILVVVITTIGFTIVSSLLVTSLLDPLTTDDDKFQDDFVEAWPRKQSVIHSETTSVAAMGSGLDGSSPRPSQLGRIITRGATNLGKRKPGSLTALWKQVDREVIQQLFGGRHAVQREQDMPMSPILSQLVRHGQASLREHYQPSYSVHGSEQGDLGVPLLSQACGGEVEVGGWEARRRLVMQGGECGSSQGASGRPTPGSTFDSSALFNQLPGDLDRVEQPPWANASIFEEDAAVMLGDMPQVVGKGKEPQVVGNGISSTFNRWLGWGAFERAQSAPSDRLQRMRSGISIGGGWGGLSGGLSRGKTDVEDEGVGASAGEVVGVTSGGEVQVVEGTNGTGRDSKGKSWFQWGSKSAGSKAGMNGPREGQLWFQQ